MKIEFKCDHCGQRYKVSDEKAGRRIRCRTCREVFRIPSIFDEEFPLEKTAGGSVVHRYEQRIRDPEQPDDDQRNSQLIHNHVQQHLGPIQQVFQEIVADKVRVDVDWVPPCDERPFHTLVTNGMSDRPMKTPPEMEQYRFAELTIALPPDWPVSKDAFEDECNYWPVRWLKRLARFPHEYDTWIFHSHTFPHGDPPKPFAENTEFCGWALLPPVLVSKEFRTFKVSPEKTIFFLAIYPLYAEEMKLKLEKGIDALIDCFEKHDICEVVDLDRPSCCSDCE